MTLDTIISDGTEFKLGCTPPDSFPTNHTAFADAFPGEMLTLDQIREALTGKPSLWGRRQRFSGPTYVRNQKQFGSCNGWAVALRLARLRELRGEPYVGLSGADAYSQMNGGRDNGSVLSDAVKVCFNGIAPESLVPYDHIYTRQISAEAVASRARFRGFKEFAVDTELELASALVAGRLGVIAVHVTNAFTSQDGNGINGTGNGPGNHSVGCDDIRMQPDGTLNFDMSNEWGTEFCSGGYSWLTWNRHLRETVKNHRFFILVSTQDDPGDDSAPPVAA